MFVDAIKIKKYRVYTRSLRYEWIKKWIIESYHVMKMWENLNRLNGEVIYMTELELTDKIKSLKCTEKRTALADL